MASWKEASKKMTLNTDSSPFQSSPLDGKASPRLFWQSRNNENSTYGSGSPSPTRRSSIERLQKASRVKNSNILALEQKQEYDPTRVPQVERPLSKVQGNAFGGTGISGYRDNKAFAHTRSESQTRIPQYSPTKSPPPLSVSPSLTRGSPPNGPRPASRDQASPTKSSLAPSRFKNSFDVDNELNSSGSSYEDRELPSGMALHRHAKSVTFDAAPPQVNEYEMATPDISSIASSSREGSIDSEDDDDDDEEEHYFMGADDHDDSFDATLEDTVKTPVVLPDDWRQDMANPMDELLEGGPMLDGFHNFPAGEIPQQDRTDSRNSNGDHRPLPPLPPPPGIFSERRNSNSSLSATAERMIGSSRTLPSPPPASSFSKSDIQNIGNGKMTLEERLKLMMLSDDGKSAAEQQRERRMRRAGTRDRADSQTPEVELHDPLISAEEDDTLPELSGLGDYELPEKISRESIMRRVDGNQTSERESDYNFSSPPSSPERPLPLDPDVPIPSTEDSAEDGVDHSAYLHHEDEQDDDMSITDYYQHSESGVEDIEEDGKDDAEKVDDSESNYSGPDLPPTPQEEKSEEEQLTTPRAASPTQQESSIDTITEKDLPALPTNQKHNPFTDDLQSFMLPKPDEADAPEETEAPALQSPFRPKLTLSKPEYDGSGWGEPDEDEEEPKTPDSVIHRPLPSYDEEEELEEERHSPAIPETVATIKSAAGSRLKTRPSATPSDIAAMREQRRQVSCEVPSLPQIPDRHRNRMSRDMDSEQHLAPDVTGDEYMQRHPSFKSRSLTLDLDLGLSLDQDFERVIEAQKRGYLMRQNTKVVAASDKDNEDLRPSTRSAGNSPVKQTRPQSWTVEPWNGQIRKKSLRKRHTSNGPVPPLPGQESNAAPMSTLVEEDASTDISAEESGERGRVFVKVMGVKDLDLPMPKNERTWFSLTLDNGVHCVTTAWLELARNAPIGQEFELVVPNDLEFQLTLNVKLERPPPQRMAQSPASPRKTKTSTFSRVFASPKKRKEMELRQKEEDERLARQQREANARKTAANPTAWDLLSPLAAEDGSFARAYVCLKEHETRCFGRPYVVDVACFNEWATEEAGFASSVKSKRGSTSIVRKAPYKIGKLELQLLFVPRPKGATDDDMPKSMNSCIREMKAAEERRSRNWEGNLSQQGGDCPLVGTKLTAYHEATRQPRATINLANAKRLIDDRRALTEKEITGKNGKRRRSAFAEEEEAYMFVEEGFRVRFNNGEIIDFYADSPEDKEGWLKVLSDVIGRDNFGNDEDGLVGSSRAKGKWCDLVLKREDTLRRRAEGRRPSHGRAKSSLV
ncbi:Bud site selection protein bud4 [Diaporthe eres]|uniref:Bud site selection protein bud4 n=1 Tax=Diaporthe eres TaxID=83184 RepID=A0ABR1PCV7_DIAER